MTPRRLPLLVCVGFSAVLVALHINAFHQMSPVDEIQHLDYVLRVRDGDFVHRGDLLLPETRRIVACRGFDAELSGMLAEDWEEPRCGDGDLEADQFPQLGFNTAWRHPPTYYAITAPLASLLNLLPVSADLLEAARWTGIGWAIATVALMWVLMGAFQVHPSNRFVLILFMVASPGVLFYLSVVTEDATPLVAGGGVLLAARAWQQGRWPAWAPVAAAGVAGALKWTNLAGVVAAALFLVVWALLSEKDRTSNAVKVASMVVVACLFMIGVWIVAQEALADVPADRIPLLQQQHVDRLDIGRTLAQTRQMVTPLRIEYLPDALEHNLTYLIVAVADAALIAVLLFRAVVPVKPPPVKKGPVSKKKTGQVVHDSTTRWAQPLAIALTIVMVTGGVAFVLVGFLVFDVFNQVQPRFGLSLLPGAFLVMASVLRSAGGRIVIGSIALSTIGIVSLSLLGA